MIRPSATLLLARTKLHSKRAMLAASIIIASLLFGALIAATAIFTALQKSAVNIVETANGDSYLVAIRPNIPNSVTGFEDPTNLSIETIRSIKAYQKEYYNLERERYKKAGVEYNESIEIPALKPSILVDESIPEERRVMINWSSPVINSIIEDKFEEYAKTAKNKASDIEALGARYNAKSYHSQGYTGLMPLPSLRLIKDGKEDFSVDYTQDAMTLTADVNAINNGSYGLSDVFLLKRNLLTTETTSLKGIPVVPTAQEVAKLFGKELGVGEEPKDESQKANWLKSVQEKANGYVYQVCYRNQTELTMLEKAKRDYAEMKSNEDNKDYQKPSLIYDFPEDVCGDIVVKSDTRTVAEKQFDKKIEDDQKKLGDYVAPMHRLLTFQIVGLTYAQSFAYDMTNINEYMKGLLSGSNFMSAASTTAVIPVQMYETLPESMKYDDLIAMPKGRMAARLNGEFKEQIVAFSTVNDARNFINDNGCRSSEYSCDKLFYTDPFGSNYLLLDDMGTAFNRLMSIAFPALLGFAVVIIWFTVSRVMAENRKETAVYRAMGAKRFDITAIYLTYILLVAIRIAVVSLIIGLGAALVVHYMYAPVLSEKSAALFGIINNAPPVNLFDASSPLIIVIVASIFAVSILASIYPLIRNVLRPPVQDMRSE